MVNGGHRQVRTTTSYVDGKCGLDKGRVLLVERNWVVGIAGITADVTYDPKFAAGSRQRIGPDERSNWLPEIYATDKDV